MPTSISAETTRLSIAAFRDSIERHARYSLAQPWETLSARRALEAIGAENMFIFGLTADRILALRADGRYRPRDLYERDPRLKRVLDAFDSDLFSRSEPGLCHWIVESILDRGDAYCQLADLPAYLDTQQQVDDTFRQPATWPSKAILNVARIGRFSSDRTIVEYARDIWGIAPV